MLSSSFRGKNGQKRAVAGLEVQRLDFHFLERERELFLSRFPAIRTVDSRWSKKQSRSTRRGLRVDTNLVEFRQLQEVWIFSYLRYSLAKSHVNGYECSKACFSRKLGLKSFEPSRENSYLYDREQ